MVRDLIHSLNSYVFIQNWSNFHDENYLNIKQNEIHFEILKLEKFCISKFLATPFFIRHWTEF